MEHTFDVGSEKSPLFNFIAREFNTRGTEQRKKLGTKEEGGALAGSLGLRNARTLALLKSPEQLPALELPERFALKYAHGWSARGVMLLRRSATPQVFFEQISQRLLHLDEVIQKQTRAAQSFPNKPDEWLVEEWLQPATPGPIPFDYKFYTFRDIVGLIVQIDRNTAPVKIAIYDGEYNPLRPGVDYILNESAQYGAHLLPKHPLQLLYWSANLSLQTDSPFVSIDLFDTPQGPAFGEFTFSPGGVHKRMFRFSGEVISMMDGLFEGRRGTRSRWSWQPGATPHGLYSAALASASLGDLSRLEAIPDILYENWSQYLYNGGQRAAIRFAEYYMEQSRAVTSAPDKVALASMADRWAALSLPRKSQV